MGVRSVRLVQSNGRRDQQPRHIQGVQDDKNRKYPLDNLQRRDRLAIFDPKEKNKVANKLLQRTPENPTQRDGHLQHKPPQNPVHNVTKTKVRAPPLSKNHQIRNAQHKDCIVDVSRDVGLLVEDTDLGWTGHGGHEG